MLRRLAVAAVCVAGTFAPAGQASVPAALTTSFETVALSSFQVWSTTCGTFFAPSGETYLGMGCMHADGAARLPPTLDQRLKAAFRGTVTLQLPENVDAVFIGYGRQPAVEYTSRPAVIWPTPGSGRYSMTIMIKWHDELTRSEATYAVPLWVPRKLSA